MEKSSQRGSLCPGDLAEGLSATSTNGESDQRRDGALQVTA